MSELGSRCGTCQIASPCRNHAPAVSLVQRCLRGLCFFEGFENIFGGMETSVSLEMGIFWMTHRSLDRRGRCEIRPTQLRIDAPLDWTRVRISAPSYCVLILLFSENTRSQRGTKDYCQPSDELRLGDNGDIPSIGEILRLLRAPVGLWERSGYPDTYLSRARFFSWKLLELIS